MSHSRNGMSIGMAVLCCTVMVGCTTEQASPEDEMIGTAKLAEVASCPVNTAGINYTRELVITATDVVNDLCRTKWDPAACVNKAHVARWTFGYLMQQMAGSGIHPSTFISKWLESFESTLTVGVAPLAARSKIRSEIINPWRVASGCQPGVTPCTLDLSKAPLRLLAIVNRTDLRDGGMVSGPYGGGNAGEARFVFGFIGQNGSALDAVVILEYKLPSNVWTPHTWAQQFHALGTKSPGETYNSALTSITEMFAAAGKAPGMPNNSAISQVRTNERAFDPGPNPVFELREQRLKCPPGTACLNTEKLLLPNTTAQTPSTSIDFTVTLRDFMNNNMNAILAGTHAIPTSMLTGASRPIAASNPFGVWSPDAPLSSVPAPDTEGDVRRLFALSTCNGCHSVEETNTNAFHIAPRDANVPSDVSPFLAGPTTITEVLEGELVTYDESLRRKCEFQWLLNGNSALLFTNAGRPH